MALLSMWLLRSMYMGCWIYFNLLVIMFPLMCDFWHEYNYTDLLFISSPTRLSTHLLIYPSIHASIYLLSHPVSQTHSYPLFLWCMYFIKFLFVHYLFTMLRQHSCLYPVEYSQVTNWLLILNTYTKMDLHSNDTELAVSILPIFLLYNV